MSSGEFVRARYQASYGGGTNIHPIRVQQETIDCVINGTANAVPAGGTNNPISANVAKGIREYGLGARSITLDWTTAPPANYSGDPVTIPALTVAFFDAAVVGQTGTYLATAVTVIGQTSERVR